MFFVAKTCKSALRASTEGNLAVAASTPTYSSLFHAIMYCPIPLVKLFAFVDQLLSNESTRTIVQTLVSLFQSGAITDEASFTLAKRTS